MIESLVETPLATWVRESWGWPFALTFHAFGTAIIVGFMFIIGLRLFGMFRTIPYTSLMKLFPWIWLGFVVQVGSGFLLWMSKPARYLTDGLFMWKFSFVIISLLLTMYFQGILRREGATWETAGSVSKRAARLVAVATLAWASVLFLGRLTAYLGQLYRAV